MGPYKERIADQLLKRTLEGIGAVLLQGPKWCGKTTTAAQHAKSILYMQEPSHKKQNLEMAQTNPALLLSGPTPRLIDEWQLAPQLWDAVRFMVDQRDTPGQFILTGSATPADMSQISHSGTGRITRLLMRPMSLYESGDSNGSVSLKDLFEHKPQIQGTSQIDLERLSFLICKGGWPKAVDMAETQALQQAKYYLNSLIHFDVSDVDKVQRDSEQVKRLLRSYARTVGSQAPLLTITQDVYANEALNYDDIINKSITIKSYLKALKNIFVIEEAPAWNPNLRSRTAIRTSDTRYFTDPSIGVAALGLGPKDLIQNLNTMGFLFENMCLRDLRIYADTLEGQVYHYRDKNNLECDAVIHLNNGNYGLVEIKLGGDNHIAEAIKTLNKLSANIDTQKMPAPAFKMVLTGIGNYAYQNKEGIFIVPVGALKD